MESTSTGGDSFMTGQFGEFDFGQGSCSEQEQ